jgi:hypothetical protein
MFSTGIIVDTLKAEAINTGDLKLFYDFNHASGEVVFNELYSTGAHFVQGQPQTQQYTIESAFPGVSIGHTNRPVTSARDSSGYFRHSDLVQVSRVMPEDNWTFFINYKSEGDFSGNTAMMLVSTKDSYSGASGFNLGVNAANRLFFDFINDAGDNIIYTQFQELGEHNIISVSKGLDEVELSYHDLAEEVHYHQSFPTSGYIKSQDWYIGHFYDQGDPKSQGNPGGSLDNGLLQDARYTGFSGWIDEFIYFNGAMSRDVKEKISTAFSHTSVTSGYSSGSALSSNKVTGVIVNPSGVTGYGQTGVSYDTFFRVYPKCGPYVDIYIPTSLSGNLTGELITYLTGTEMITGVEMINVPGARVISYQRLASFAKRNICFTNLVSEQSDRAEFYSTQAGIKNLSYLATYRPSDKGYFLDTGFSGENLAVYSNGLLIYSGEYTTSLSDYKVNFNNTPFDHKNRISYHRVVGGQEALPYSGDLPVVVTTNSDHFNKDIYLRPTGVIGATKLISGVDFEFAEEQVKIYTSNDFIKNIVSDSNNSGEFIFVSPRYGADAQFYSSGVGFVKTNTSLQSEALWVNGVKQPKESSEASGKSLDRSAYSLVDNKSLLLTNQFFTGFNTVFFDNYDTFWNDSGTYL